MVENKTQRIVRLILDNCWTSVLLRLECKELLEYLKELEGERMGVLMLGDNKDDDNARYVTCKHEFRCVNKCLRKVLMGMYKVYLRFNAHAQMFRIGVSF